MSDIRVLSDNYRVQELDANNQTNRRNKNQHYSSGSHQKNHPARTTDQIKDTAIVMGIPMESITPEVLEAMTLILTEMDSIRWKLEASIRREEILASLLRENPMFSVCSYHAFQIHLADTIKYATAADESSFLLFFKVLNCEDYWLQHGHDFEINFLKNIIEIIKKNIGNLNIMGSISNTEFGIIFNLYRESDVVEKMKIIRELLANNPFILNDKSFQINIKWSLLEITASSNSLDVLREASDNARVELSNHFDNSIL